MQTVIVGVDGSSGARAALEFAAEEAAVREAKLHVVAAWEVGPTPVGRFSTVDLIETYRTSAEEARQAASDYLESVWPALEVTAETWEGPAADVLVSLAREADLLVVGNRGRGDVASLVLGSVSHHVVQHAPCPVVVIPRRWGAADPVRAISHRSAV